MLEFIEITNVSLFKNKIVKKPIELPTNEKLRAFLTIAGLSGAEVLNSLIPSVDLIFDNKKITERNLFVRDVDSENDTTGELIKIAKVEIAMQYPELITLCTSLSMLFYYFRVKSLNLELFDTSNIKDMKGLFFGAHVLKKVNLSSFNTSNVKSMGYMFSDCSSLKMLDLSSFNTSNVENFNGMFNNCKMLQKVIGTFNYSSCSSKTFMYYGTKPNLRRPSNDGVY